MKAYPVASLVALALITLAVGPADARDWNVLPNGSGDAPTIQAAVDSAGVGDVIILGDGTFAGIGNRDVDFLGKPISITSLTDAASTVIDCEDSARAFVFQTSETVSASLSNVTIRNGFSSSDGGAIYVFNASPGITGCVIEDCTGRHGGGIHIEAVSGGALSTIRNNVITRCTSTIHGGGIACVNSSPTIDQNEIWDNQGDNGAGVFIQGVNAGPDLTRNLIHDNTSTGFGGGIRVQASAGGMSMTENVIWGNSASTGGGMSLQLAAGTIEQNTITENSATSEGSGLHLTQTSVFFRYGIVAFNTGAPAITCADPSAWISCALVHNPGVPNSFACQSSDITVFPPDFCGAPLPERDFSLTADSPATEGNSPCGVRLGALDPGCGTNSIDPANWGRVKAGYR